MACATIDRLCLIEKNNFSIIERNTIMGAKTNSLALILFSMG
ncbi:hypothetical protein CUZ89_0459 [Enterococcus xinjiangensis]|nr:hypothetical protein [Enterococcus lactis]